MQIQQIFKPFTETKKCSFHWRFCWISFPNNFSSQKIFNNFYKFKIVSIQDLLEICSINIFPKKIFNNTKKLISRGYWTIFSKVSNIFRASFSAFLFLARCPILTSLQLHCGPGLSNFKHLRKFQIKPYHVGPADKILIFPKYFTKMSKNRKINNSSSVINKITQFS